jgi:signal transduction histidine kinase
MSKISQEMSELNFNVKSDVNSKDELGVLSHNLNDMSYKLQQTIEELKEANKKLKKDIEHKEEVDKMRKEFISNVSHELKTPIALIQGYAEGLEECVNDDAESREFYCSVIADEASKMNKMVKELLSLNQLEYGDNILEIDEFSLNMVVKGVISRINYMSQQKNVNIRFIADKDYTIFADEFKIEEVITNYVTNALNHVDDNRVVEVSIKETSDNKIRLSVYNSGENIPNEDLENIWIKFYKVDKARTRAYGGSGIGLSIVKAITDAHGGKCGVINKEHGVEFWFEISKEAHNN